MRRTALLWIAGSSALLLPAAARPRYGGVLRVQQHATVRSIDPSDWPADSGEGAAKEKLVSQVFETLVVLNDKGEPRPLLAVSWTHEPARKRWVFTPRPNVELHNEEIWKPAGGVITVPDDRAIEDILRDLARPRNAIAVRLSDGTLAGTGPFRVVRWEAGKSVELAAHENYWGGRPFLDGIEVRMGRSYREQSVDFELGQADVIELPIADTRRARDRGARVAVSAPVEILAIVFDAAKPDGDRTREGLALSFDRAAMHSVLLQKQGESSAALLPQWLSGFAFLFPAERNLAAARTLAAGSAPVSLLYDRQDALARAVAERIVVNAGEAGLAVRPVQAGPAEAKLVRLRIPGPDPRLALESFAAALQVKAAPPLDLFEWERSLLAGFRVIPLFHLPAAYQVSPRVHNWIGAPWVVGDRWQLGDVWLESKMAP
jgi:peptide/nickel transport system substrate-binding protein